MDEIVIIRDYYSKLQADSTHACLQYAIARVLFHTLPTQSAEFWLSG